MNGSHKHNVKWKKPDITVPYGSIYIKYKTQAKIISCVTSQDTGYSWGEDWKGAQGTLLGSWQCSISWSSCWVMSGCAPFSELHWTYNLCLFLYSCFTYRQGKQTQLPLRSGFFQTSSNLKTHCYSTGILRRKKKGIWECPDIKDTR